MAIQEHWAAKIEPIGTACLGLVLAIVIGSIAPTRIGMLADAAWWMSFVLIGRAIWETLSWRVSWFIATDKRLLLLYGLVTKRVAMMPLSKVTDMSYSRSPLGRILGYGTFTLESAGQDQALQQLTYVRDPDHTYRAICQEIFGDPDGPDWSHLTDPHDPRSDGEDGPDDDDGGGGPRDGDDDTGPIPDPTDLPVRRMGTYLAPQDGSSYGRRRLRGRRSGSKGSEGNAEPKIPGIISEAEHLEDASWQVSREDAPQREQVPRRTAGWWD
ncbi:PH domain-containing protein [Dermacoccaceae bacterium W4C1]